MESIIRHNDALVDELEVELISAANNTNSDVQYIDCPLSHWFSPNLYVREIYMPFTPKGTVITSKVHKTTHKFCISQGKVMVSIDGKSGEIFEAPYIGTTLGGTRRTLVILEDTVWSTYHYLPFIKGDENNLSGDELNELLQKIEDYILEPYENKLLGGIVTRNKISNTKTISNEA